MGQYWGCRKIKQQSLIGMGGGGGGGGGGASFFLAVCENKDFAPCSKIRIPECKKFLRVEFGIRDLFARWIRNPWLWNPEYSSRSPESH